MSTAPSARKNGLQTTTASTYVRSSMLRRRSIACVGLVVTLAILGVVAGLRASGMRTPTALLTRKPLQHKPTPPSEELGRYYTVRERFVEGIRRLDLGEDKVELVLNQVMSTVGSLLDYACPAPQGQARSSTSATPRTSSRAAASIRTDSDAVDPRRQDKYVFESPFAAGDRSYVNKRFSIPDDIATSRGATPECATVFERTKALFLERFRDAEDAVKHARGRPDEPPKYPLPAGGKGGLLFLRHVHKTGGSTIRHLFETFSDWTISHWSPRWIDMDGWFDHFESYASPNDEEGRQAKLLQQPKFLVEAHAGSSGIAAAQEHFTDRLARLKKSLGSKGLDCPISIVFFRDPLSMYISVFRWAVVANQRGTATWMPPGLRGNYFWGSTFLEWAPDNALSRIMYSARDKFFDRRFLQLRHLDVRHGMVFDRGYSPFTSYDPTFNETHYESLRTLLGKYDIVAPLSHFDHVMAMLTLLYGWDELPYYTSIRPAHPTECYSCTSKETDEEICPDMKACRSKVEQIAPFDYLIYNEFAQRFEKQLEYLGDEFMDYVAAYRSEFNERIALTRNGTTTDATNDGMWLINSKQKSAGSDGMWLRSSKQESAGSAGKAFSCKNKGPDPGADCIHAAEDKLAGTPVSTKIREHFELPLPEHKDSNS